MTYPRPEALVDTAWLAARLDDPAVRVVDGSWYLPAEQRDPKAEYAAGHIPGAGKIGSAHVCTPASREPLMFPDLVA